MYIYVIEVISGWETEEFHIFSSFKAARKWSIDHSTEYKHGMTERTRYADVDQYGFVDGKAMKINTYEVMP